MIDRPRDKRRSRREARKPIEKPRRNDDVKELAAAVRLLLRHGITCTSPGGGVPPRDLMQQMIRLDKLFWDHEWRETDEFRRHNNPRGTKNDGG